MDGLTPEVTRDLQWAARELSRRWPVELRGSWASREYHLVGRGGVWDSLSDFDLVTHDVLDEETRNEISEFLRFHARILRSEPAISFRTANELGDVYRRERSNKPVKRNRSEAERLIMFWLSIGLAESFSSIEKYRSFEGCDVKAYFDNKTYLNAWRMMFHVNGIYFRSYAAVLDAIPGVSSVSKRTSLLLKLGVEHDPNTSSAIEELGSALMRGIAALGPSKDSTETLRSLWIGTLHNKASVPNAIDILGIARNYAASTIDESIVDHSAAKLAKLAGGTPFSRALSRGRGMANPNGPLTI